MPIKTHTLIELEYHSDISYQTPFDEIELDIYLTTPSKETFIIPAFWAGAQIWKVRFIPTELGTYEIRSTCTDNTNPSLHHVKEKVSVTEEGNNTYAAPLKLSQERQYLLRNNTPFFWLSDTWWMALSSRLTHKNFIDMVTHRKKQGFNVIQLVAGLFPDMGDFDTRAKNEGGLPWHHDEHMQYTTINPAYFDAADVRIAHLAKNGFTLAILGAWGYYLESLGTKKMKQHWRYIIARWGAYPTVWCSAGEATMPYYLSTDRDRYAQHQQVGWTVITQYIKEIDPFSRLLTIHPTEIGTEQITNPSLLDINLLQASHHGYESIKKSIALLQQTYPNSSMPLIMDEINYEGILHDTHDAMQRLSFWTSVLCGSKGYGYGANGIWQVNTSQEPFGPSPHGAVWGNTPWDEALQLKGAQHINLGKQLLESFPWQTLEPIHTQLSPIPSLNEAKAPRMAGIDDTLRIVYFYGGLAPWDKQYSITKLIKKTNYKADFWNPRTGVYHTIGMIETDYQGRWEIPTLPTLEDWVVVLEYYPQDQMHTNKKDFSTHISPKHALKKWIKRYFF